MARPIARDYDRKANQLRPVTIERGVTPAPGSVRIRCGATDVLCTAMIEDKVPEWMMAANRGWLTASYQMLPACTPRRKAPSSRPDGRATEIKRLIGRSLRAAVDFRMLGPRTIHIDCHVLYADAGTRTTCINGGYLALHDAIQGLLDSGAIKASPLKYSLQAVSVGLVDGEPRLDLYYPEDSAAQVDLNVVSANGDKLVEVQGTAEGEPFSRAEMNTLIDLAFVGLEQLAEIQDAALKSPKSVK